MKRVDHSPRVLSVGFTDGVDKIRQPRDPYDKAFGTGTLVIDKVMVGMRMGVFFLFLI